MLEVRDVSVVYGQHRALTDAALRVGRGEIVVILGANGAGKTTCLKAIAGIVACLPGKRVTLSGRDISSLPAHQIVEAGLALVPEGRGIFADLTVAENLLLGANPRRARDGEAARRGRVLSLFPRLGERLTQTVRTMSGGEQQMVAIGRALMSNPDILLLDEPSLGLSPLIVQEMFNAIRRVNEAGTAVLLVEQNVATALRVAHRAYVLEEGRMVAEGTPDELMSRDEIRRAYLGV
jgi:branched-chain amino acid transport system ATP-binding protein